MKFLTSDTWIGQSQRIEQNSCLPQLLIGHCVPDVLVHRIGSWSIDDHDIHVL